MLIAFIWFSPILEFFILLKPIEVLTAFSFNEWLHFEYIVNRMLLQLYKTGNFWLYGGIEYRKRKKRNR